MILIVLLLYVGIFTYILYVFTVSSSVIKTAVTYISYNATGKLYSIIVDCTIHPDSTADHYVVTAMADDSNITGIAVFTNLINFIT